MILTQLKLTNFRSFGAGVIDFAPGQNYVFGMNWQGKSSVVDAIGFALFGNDVLPRRVAGAVVKAEHLLREGASRGRVELSFTLGEREYVIARSLPSHDAKLSCGGQVIASGVRRVAEQLKALLGIDAKLFQNVFYADQDELRKSLEFTPEDRRVFIERILGQELWRKRALAIGKTIRELEGFCDELRSGKLGALIEELDELTAQVEERRDEIASIKAELSERGERDGVSISAIHKQMQRSSAQIERHQLMQQRLEFAVGRDQELMDAIAQGVCPTCTQPVAPSLRRSRIAALRASLKANDAELQKVKKALEALEKAYEEADYDGALTRQEELSTLKGRYTALMDVQKSDAERERKLRKQSRIFGKKTEQLSAASDEIEFLRKLARVIEEYRSNLRERILDGLGGAMNDFLSRFHDGDNDIMVVLDSELTVKTRLHGKEVPLFNISGAAKDILALALRYGLLRVSSGCVRFLVLDEPTRHMDAMNCRRLKGLFDELHDHQIVVVTVHQEFEQARGKHFFVRKDDKCCSVISAGPSGR